MPRAGNTSTESKFSQCFVNLWNNIAGYNTGKRRSRHLGEVMDMHFAGLGNVTDKRKSCFFVLIGFKWKSEDDVHNRFKAGRPADSDGIAERRPTYGRAPCGSEPRLIPK